jgi:hypothetical protein
MSLSGFMLVYFYLTGPYRWLLFEKWLESVIESRKRTAYKRLLIPIKEVLKAKRRCQRGSDPRGKSPVQAEDSWNS